MFPGNMLLVAVNKIVARLLLDTKGYILLRYRQHVAGNKQHVAGQQTGNNFVAVSMLLYVNAA